MDVKDELPNGFPMTKPCLKVEVNQLKGSQRFDLFTTQTTPPAKKPELFIESVQSTQQLLI